PYRSGWPTTVFGIILALIGLVLAIGGVRLIMLGGSWYYLIAGAALIVSGALYIRRRAAGAWVYAAIFVGTVIWSFYEIGTAFWGWVPRMAPILVLGLFAALLFPRLIYRRAPLAYGAVAVQLLVLVVGAVSM